MNNKYSQALKKIALTSGISLYMLSTAFAAEQNLPATGSATNITQTSAQLGATFKSVATFATVSWGPASKKIYIANCGPLSTNPASQSCAASGLTCNTKYAYHALQLGQNDQANVGKRLYFTTAACK